MTGIRKWKASVMACAAAGALLLSAGCSYPGDTSGYHPKPLRTKAQISQDIANINANATMPASVKAMALKQLNQELANAK